MVDLQATVSPQPDMEGARGLQYDFQGKFGC